MVQPEEYEKAGCSGKDIPWDRVEKYVLRFAYIISRIKPSDFTKVSGWAITQA